MLEYNGIEVEYAEQGRLLTKPADVAFLMLPTQFVRGALRDNSQFINSQTIIVNGAKGIEEKTHLLVYQIVEAVGSYKAYYSLLGPSFAHGIKAKHPTLVSLGYEDPKYLKLIEDLLRTPYFRLRPIKGYPALELASAMKNLYAILCGYAHGLGYGMNTQAMLITLALTEFTQLAEAMGFQDYDALAPGVVGDLMLTCSSEQSRNFKFGLHLGREDHQVVQEMLANTVEGYHTSHSIRAISRQLNIKLPLALLALELTNDKGGGAARFNNFIKSY